VNASHPFTDPAVVPGLYEHEDRQARRTSALHRAKTQGRRVAEVIADLAAARKPAVVADIGCGRGSSTRALAERLGPSSRIIALDAAHAMLQATRPRLREHRSRAGLVQADFHRLPLADESCDLAVAAFCLYHSTRPTTVITEMARCLASGGTAILVTKSADSYAELDHLIAASRLDPDATRRPSLYETAHSTNLPDLAAQALAVEQTIHERHVFRFADLGHLAEYMSTVPKYRLPPHLRNGPKVLATELRRRLPEGPVTTTSTVTYVVARRASAS
jgi:ubiquinone/menaquinone biosynthesis C-methylase UbiE